jgi:hypothetical protein
MIYADGSSRPMVVKIIELVASTQGWEDALWNVAVAAATTQETGIENR